MKATARTLAIVTLGVLGTACTRRGGGPHLQLVTPSGATPNFGDAPSRSSESLRQGGPGGGGGAAQADPAGNGGARGNAIGPIIGGAVGVGAAAAAVIAGAIKCEPGADSPSTGSSVNLCSGERTPAPPPP
jgi:hypothetical protein